jgi:hypothetical protein
MRAASIAHVDLEFDAKEEAVLDRLLALLKLSQEDTELLHRTVSGMDQANPGSPEPRLEELFKQSSFAG